MIDFIGILTRTWIGLHAPAGAQIQSAPLVATPAAGSAATAAVAPSAGAAVDNVQKFYAGIKQVTAKFRQSVTNKTFGTTKDSDGKVWLAKPGKMRWDYYDAKKKDVTVNKSFISNGTTLYVVEHGNKQVVKKNLSQDLMPVAVTFLYGKGDLKTAFNSEIDASSKYGSKDDLVLKLTPKQPSAQYKNLYLVVNKSDFHVSQSIIIDSSDNVNQFRFYEPDFEKEVKPEWFEFNEASVKNYRIIDADQPRPGAGSAAAPSMPAPMPAVPAPPATK
ncbi:MAG: outer rane lipoprotein carrier protein LolA [Myxococcales bacterium]|nr:outer rane lipoprotein carrier protein LolA [Myxococcales bacterium]